MVFVHYEDCISGMKRLIDDESIDLIIADPPFGLGFDKKDKGNYGRDSKFVIDGYHEAPEDYYRFSMDWIRQAVRVLKDTGTIYIYSGWNHLLDVMSAADNHDLFMRGHLIWKRTFGAYRRWGYVTAHYHILYYTKNDGECGQRQKHTFNKILIKHPKKKDKMYHYPEDVFTHKVVYQKGELKNGTKLPIDQVKYLVKTSSNEGDMVLDPFLGNGTTLDASLKMRRKFSGFEINTQCIPIIDKILRSHGHL